MSGIEKLGENTRIEIVRQFKGLLDTHAAELNAAHIKHEDEVFTISCKAKISVKGTGVNRIDAEISFKPEPDMKDSASGTANEAQICLFNNQEGE